MQPKQLTFLHFCISAVKAHRLTLAAALPVLVVKLALEGMQPNFFAFNLRGTSSESE